MSSSWQQCLKYFLANMDIEKIKFLSSLYELDQIIPQFFDSIQNILAVRFQLVATVWNSYIIVIIAYSNYITQNIRFFKNSSNNRNSYVVVSWHICFYATLMQRDANLIYLSCNYRRKGKYWQCDRKRVKETEKERERDRERERERERESKRARKVERRRNHSHREETLMSSFLINFLWI